MSREVKYVLEFIPEIYDRTKNIADKLDVSSELIPCLEAQILNNLLLHLASKVKHGKRVDLENFSRKIEKAVSNRTKLERLVKICEFYLRLFSKNVRVVVDVGCGVGLNIMIAKRYGCERGLLVGVDVDSYFLSIFKRVNKDVEGILADVERLPLRDNSVNVLFSTMLIHELPSLEAISEFYRVLSKEGIALVGDVVVRYVPCILLNMIRAIKVKLGREPETPYTLKQIVSKIYSLNAQVDYCLRFWKGPLGIVILTFKK